VKGTQDEIALRVEGIGKTYQLWASPAQRLLAPIWSRVARLVSASGLPAPARRLEAWARSGCYAHEALHEVSFTLRRGEALGIIGANGSGKSTLLQIVAGVLAPSRGTVSVQGRVAALLELGSGFSPELTGRENIRINAAILGLESAQIDARIDDIIAFADIGDYIDQPVKAYSSGMAVRLAFAVQVHIDPDVLIVDEALAVGDAAFQAKAIAKIDEILSRGTTLLFVGHDLNALKAFCHSAMLLEKGRVVMSGLPDEVAQEYLARTRRATQQSEQLRGGTSIDRIDRGYGPAAACVTQGVLNGGRHDVVPYGGGIDLVLRVRLGPDLRHPLLVLDVLDTKGLQISGRRIALPAVPAVREIDVEVQFAALLQRGVYWMRMRLVDEPPGGPAEIVARQQGWLSFEVDSDSRDRFVGLFALPMDVRVRG
jgi:lipopolysaccharide transport system ATP-binding protein